MECVVATLGFDPANVLRPLIAAGISRDYRLILVTSSRGGDYEREKTTRAVEDLKKMTGKEPVVLAYPVELWDLPRLVHDLRENCRGAERATLLLSGGLRPLILLTLSAALTLWRHAGIEVRVFTMREDGTSSFTLWPEYFAVPDLGEREAEVLEALRLHGGRMRRKHLVKYLMEKWGTSHVIIYRRLRNMEQKRLIEANNEYIQIQPLGAAVLEAATARGEHPRRGAT